MAAERFRPRIVATVPTPNRSARTRGVPILLTGVIHSTEGGGTPRSLGEFFARTATRASSNVGVSAAGESGVYCPTKHKAWTQGGFNGRTFGSIENIGFASQKSWPREQLRENARWLARWSLMSGLPLRRAGISGGNVTRTGVATHKDLGSHGGGHHDPGPAFPVRRVLLKAITYRARLRAGR